MEQHGDHNNVHGVPVGVPVDLYHPLPEIQIKPCRRDFINYFVISSLPDPDTNTEVGKSHEEHDDVCDEEDVLESLKPPMGRLHFCIAH